MIPFPGVNAVDNRPRKTERTQIKSYANKTI